MVISAHSSQNGEMSTPKTPRHLTTKPLMMTGSGLAALALLTGCATGDDGGAEQPPAPEGAEQAPAPEGAATSPPAAEPTDPATEGGTATDTASPTSTDTASPTDATAGPVGDDAVFPAIEAVLAEYSDGIITDIDREDDRDEYEIDVVVGNEVIEVDVLEDGTVREDDRDDDDDDDIQEAQDAQVTAEEAIGTALEGREGQILDEAELNEDDGQLRWEIELDRAEGGDGDEIDIDAMTGEIIGG